MNSNNLDNEVVQLPYNTAMDQLLIPHSTIKAIII